MSDKSFSFLNLKKPCVMAILNYTPDSFSDGGDYFTPSVALNKAFELQNSGADIIDIGATSTRPNNSGFDEKEELRRLHEVLPAVCEKIKIPISVDTFFPECALYALECGASIINDVSGTYNHEISKMIKRFGAGYVVTHNPSGADIVPSYENGVIVAVRSFFIDCIEQAKKDGIPSECLCLDPGFGFGKTTEQNIEMLNCLSWLKFKPYALLIGLSRKRFTGEIYNLSNARDRDNCSFILEKKAYENGADIIRTHTVKDYING
ncbi:MAG: dihydropteroate synthase [Clostridiales bacterium]|nr:dihydropteroate synthase [Clostridiales bacterium]